jgi:hypothetical protein
VERGLESEPTPLEAAQRGALAFLRREAGFAQVYTVNRAGFPVGRTMGAPVDDDWTVNLVQRGVHRRLGQLRSNPHVEIVWVGAPAPTSVNDHPHVYDFGLTIPRVVFLRGIAEVMDDEWTIEHFERETAIQRAKGHMKAPLRSRENVRDELVGVRVRPVRVRLEGFGEGPETHTWAIEEEQ